MQLIVYFISGQNYAGIRSSAQDPSNEKITLYITGLASVRNAAASVVRSPTLLRLRFRESASPGKVPLGFQCFPTDNYQNLAAESLQPYPECLKPILRSLMNVSGVIDAPGLSFGSHSSSFSPLPVPVVLEDDSQPVEPTAEDSAYLADESNLAPNFSVLPTTTDAFNTPEELAEVGGEARRALSLSLAQLFERAAPELAAPRLA